jgi:FAD/FMN-containing dehydrogenase
VPAALLARPTIHVALAAYRDGGSLPAPPPGFVEDASRLETVPVEAHTLSPHGFERELRALLARARSARTPIAIAGARHTMGGHTSTPHGIVVDTSLIRSMRLEERRNILTVGAGAHWSEVLAYVDPAGKSVGVMQAYSSFSVGGSLGANAHGWQHDRPPIASSVESFRMMLADGSVVRASRSENAELFRLAIGGYGLFGVMLDVELRVVDNALYAAQRFAVQADEYVPEFARRVQSDPKVRMAYGRLSVAPRRFLTEALLTAYREVPAASIPRLAPAKESQLNRAVFRGSVGSDYGKELRWELESALGGEAGDRVSRNQILDEPVALFENRDPSRTDILQEYFVPPASFAHFLGRMRDIVPRYSADLLNVTVRTVLRDDDSFLRYADQPMFALVLLFCIPRTPEADEGMVPLTRELIDAAIALGGRHYLPYRLQATAEQLARAYPQATALFAAKRRWDPETLFQNHFFTRYSGV